MSSADNTSNLPILPETSQNFTPVHTSPDSLATSATSVEVHRTPPPPRALSTRQLNAIPLILAGHSDQDVAEAIGVTRECVCKWRNHHPLFIAHLNRQRTLRHADTLDRLDRVLNTALQQIEEYQHSYTAADTLAHLGLRLLRFTGRRILSTPLTPPPINPHEIELDLLQNDLPIAPDDSPANDLPPPPPPPPKKPRNPKPHPAPTPCPTSSQ